MKKITISAPTDKLDASLDRKLNPVGVASGEVVSWAVAFPRAKNWHVDATIGAVLATASSTVRRRAATEGEPAPATVDLD